MATSELHPQAAPDPGRAEVFITRLMLHGALSGEYRRFVAHMELRGHERVLDFGSGSGAAARHLAPALQAGGGRLTCLDISPGWQRVARRTLRAYPCVDFALGDVRALGLPAEGFDAIVVHWMFHDVPEADRALVLAELTRLLRPAGQVFLREPTRRGEGIEPSVLRELLSGAGLRERRGVTASHWLFGPHYDGAWEKLAG